jgi:dihydrolipoamide dehydrogenase
MKYDIAIIGGGPAGTAAAVRAAQLGKTVCLIEQNFLGGTCLNMGCIPTKFLSEAVSNIKKVSKLYAYGLKAQLEPFKFSDIIAKKNQTVQVLRKGIELKVKSYGIEYARGKAALKNANTIIVNDTEISAGKIIIAAGSAPSSVTGLEFNGENIIDSNFILNLSELPKNLLIVGGGAIGVEMATIFAALGVNVTVAEYTPSILPGEDAELIAEVHKNLNRQGVEIITNCKTAAELAKNFQKVLVSTGRKFSDNLNLKAIGIEFTPKGFIKTDDTHKTNIENIYAVGDCAGKNLLAYTAHNDGVEAVEHITGTAAVQKMAAQPHAVFSAPPAASVRAPDFENYKNVLTGKFPFTVSGKAFIGGERGGFIKTALCGDTFKLIGCWIVGADAPEIIHTATMIINSQISVKNLKQSSFFHPSLSEGIFSAITHALGCCVELPKAETTK